MRAASLSMISLLHEHIDLEPSSEPAIVQARYTKTSR